MRSATMRSVIVGIGFVALLLCAPFGAIAQTATSGAKTFDAASVHVNRSGTSRPNISFTQGAVTLVNLPLRTIIQYAYGINDLSHLDNLPSWATTERFDIVARGSIHSPEDRSAMLQALLADRFQLETHREQRRLPMYTLILARADGRLGSSLQPSATDCEAPSRDGAETSDSLPGVPCGFSGRPGEIKIVGAPITALASVLSLALGRAVVEGTRLNGRYDIQLIFATNSLPGRDAEPNPDGRPALLTALREQLGLQLQPGNRSQDVLVIDRVSRPVDN